MGGAPGGTDIDRLDAAVDAVARKKDEWARLPVRDRIALLERCLRNYLRTADAVVARGSAARGIEPGSVESGEEWIAGPLAVVRQLRLLIQSLRDIAREGRPSLPRGAVHRAPTGELAVTVFPRDGSERLMFPGTRMDVWMQPGVTDAMLPDTMAPAYRHEHPPGRVVAVLGAGNVASIAPTDVLHKLVVEHATVVLKMHPLNADLGPLLERAFEPLITPGYLRVVDGGVAEGQHLVHHPRVDAVHLTGSAAVHDRIVWGETADEQARRRAAGCPKLAKPVTSELGCVTPVIVVPGTWSEGALQYHAEHVATMVVHGASTTCIAAKVLVTWRGWPQRRAFLDRLSAVLAAQRPRLAHYPGAAGRYEAFLAAYPNARRLREAPAGLLACATIYDIAPEDSRRLAFETEAWSPVLAETPLPSSDEGAFLADAVGFCNEHLFGTLSAHLLVPPNARARRDASVDAAVSALRYGTVAVNHWSGLNFVLGAGPWGAYPGHTLEDVGSGIGWVHNPSMFDRPLKTVVWGPFISRPKPPWFVTHRQGHVVGRRMTAFEAARSWWKVPAIAWAALRG
jgi:acyl-CoA reductase-like NAD-dependent aldehyde dehydrogenase